MNKIELMEKLNSLLAEKQFGFLRSILEEIKIFLKVDEDSASEVQARYSSPAYAETTGGDFFADHEIVFEVNLKSWKRLSSKDRRLLCQLVLLTFEDNWYYLYLKPVLRLNSDELSRYLSSFFREGYTEDPLRYSLEEDLIHALYNLKASDRVYLERRIEDIKRNLSRGGVTFQDLFQITPRIRTKRPAKRKHRHKGYRDHGTLRKSDRPTNRELGSQYQIDLRRKASDLLDDNLYEKYLELEFFTKDFPDVKFWS